MTRTSGVGGFATAAALLASAAVCAALAAWGPTAAGGGGGTVVVVRDVSASVAGHLPDRQGSTEWQIDGAETVAGIVFGQRARVAVDPVDVEDFSWPVVLPDVGAAGSDLASALTLAAEIAARSLKVGVGWDVHVRTDGLVTSSRAALADAALALRRAGCRRFTVQLLSNEVLPPRVTELHGPGRTAVGRPLALECVGIAGPGGGVVRLFREGRVLDERRVPRAGPFRVSFTRIPDVPGSLLFSARMAGDNGLPGARANVVVAAEGRPLVIRSGGPGGVLFGALPQGAVFVDAGVAESSLERLLAGCESVVIDNVAERFLSGRSVELLRRFVESGGGLLVLGGPDTFGEGGWAGRPVERLSPLECRPRDDRGQFLYLALDGSGSMARAWAASGASGATRDQVVREAARALVDGAARDTVLGLRRFAGALLPESAPPSVIALGPGGRDEARAWISGLRAPGGSTALLPPLEEARSLCASRGERRRAALFFSDGRSSEGAEDVAAAVRALVNEGVGVTFVLSGEDAEAARALTQAGASVRQAASPEELSRVFRQVEGAVRAEKTVLHDREVRVTRAGRALFSGPSPVSSVIRMNRTWAAADATVLLESVRGEPLVAVASRGRGRVAAVATSANHPGWLAEDEAAAVLLRAVVRSVTPPAHGDVRVEWTDEGELLVAVGGSQGAPDRVRWTGGTGDVGEALLARAPAGLLTASVPRTIDRSSGLRFVRADGSLFAQVGVDSPAALEFRHPPAADLEAIAALATVGGSGERSPLRPWLAAVSVLLAVAAVGRMALTV